MKAILEFFHEVIFDGMGWIAAVLAILACLLWDKHPFIATMPLAMALEAAERSGFNKSSVAQKGKP